jgi:hypothetical protein
MRPVSGSSGEPMSVGEKDERDHCRRAERLAERPGLKHGDGGTATASGLVRSATKVPEALQVLGRDVGADLLTGDRERRTAADKLQRLGPGDDVEEDLVSAGAGDFTHRELWAWLDQPFTGPATVLIASQAVLGLG